MPESETSITVILLAVCAGLLVLTLILLVRMYRRLARLEILVLRDVIGAESAAASVASLVESSAGGAFETFLQEDPARRKMTKSEQFSAYRQWRQDKGMNWSNS